MGITAGSREVQGRYRLVTTELISIIIIIIIIITFNGGFWNFIEWLDIERMCKNFYFFPFFKLELYSKT